MEGGGGGGERGVKNILEPLKRNARNFTILLLCIRGPSKNRLQQQKKQYICDVWRRTIADTRWNRRDNETVWTSTNNYNKNRQVNKGHYMDQVCALLLSQR